MRVVPQLIKNGNYIRPSLGIEISQDINDRLVAESGTEGVAVLRVRPGSAAEKAGLNGVVVSEQGWLAGDIIVALNGKEIKNIQSLLTRLDDQKVGDTVTLTVVNDGKKREVEVTLQAGT
jgi:S1-C subfamily serine protease